FWFAFDGQPESVGGNVLKNLFCPAWPVNLHEPRARCAAEPEIGAQLALGKIASAAGNFANLRNSSCYHANARAHRIAIALCAGKLEIYKMISAVSAVAQQGWRISVVRNDHIHKAIVVKIQKCGAASCPRR